MADASSEESLGLGIRVLFVGEVSDSSNPTGLQQVTLDGYERFDLTLEWHAHPRASFFVAVDNLFDQEYQEAVGFPAVGIYPRVGTKLRF